MLIEGHGGGTLNHLGVEVETGEEVLAAEARLSTDGVETTGVDDTMCCYALKTETWVSDPDGAPWEFYVKTGDAEQMTNTIPAEGRDGPVLRPGSDQRGGVRRRRSCRDVVQRASVDAVFLAGPAGQHRPALQHVQGAGIGIGAVVVLHPPVDQIGQLRSPARRAPRTGPATSPAPRRRQPGRHRVRSGPSRPRAGR